MCLRFLRESREGVDPTLSRIPSFYVDRKAPTCARSFAARCGDNLIKMCGPHEKNRNVFGKLSGAWHLLWVLEHREGYVCTGAFCVLTTAR